MLPSHYYTDLFIAYARGRAKKTGTPCLSATLTEKPLSELSEEEMEKIFSLGREAGLKLYRFKNTHEELPRVKRVLGFLKGIAFESLLDVGSGRGVFLFPFLQTFPWVRVTSVDILDYRVEFLSELSEGGVDSLSARLADITEAPFPEKSVDVVTMLEVLEHIPSVEKAVKAAVRTARRFVVVSVPSREDSNPEHIHLLTKSRLSELFSAAGCDSLSFDGVNGHLILIANVGEEK